MLIKINLIKSLIVVKNPVNILVFSIMFNIRKVSKYTTVIFYQARDLISPSVT